MIRRSLAMAGAACLALAGCAVGPDYKAPPTPTTAGFAAATPAIATPAAPSGDWWRLYQDPALDGLIQAALANNKDIAVAAANLAEARGLLGEARAGRYPSTNVGAGAQYGRGAAFLGVRPPQGWTFSPAFDVSYEVDLFGRVSRTIEAAGADTDAAAAAADAVRVSVVAETARAYAEACADAQSLAVVRRSVDLVSQTLDITVRRRDAGAVPDFDVARARALVEQTRASAPSFEGRRRAALFELAVLTGRPPEEISPAADACKAPPRIATPIPVGDGAALLRRRPDVRQAERRLAAATARVGVATASLYPTVTLGGSVSSVARSLSGLGAASTMAYGIGPLISWNFPNVAVSRARIAQAEARSAGALASFDGVVLNALKETEQALALYGSELDRRAALTAARDQNAEAARFAELRYQAGAASFLDLIDAQRSLVDAEQALASSDAQLVSNQITVFKALGGGWEQSAR